VRDFSAGGLPGGGFSLLQVVDFLPPFPAILSPFFRLFMTI